MTKDEDEDDEKRIQASGSQHHRQDTCEQVTSIQSDPKPLLGFPERIISSTTSQNQIEQTNTSSSSSSPFLLSDPLKLGSGSGSSDQVQYRTARSSNSRPTSDELDVNVLTTSTSSNRGSSIFGGTSSEYETCVTSQDGSTQYVSAVSSQDTSNSYMTARTSLSSSQSSRGSTLVSDSGSDHLATPSDTSETLVGDLRDVATPTPSQGEIEEMMYEEGEDYEEEPTLHSSSTIVLAANDPRLMQKEQKPAPDHPDFLSRNDDASSEILSLSEQTTSASVSTAIPGPPPPPPPPPLETKPSEVIDLDLKTVASSECPPVTTTSSPFSPQQQALTSPLSLTGSMGSIDLPSTAGSIISHSSVR